VLGERKPVWLTDPRDAQYLNTTVAELKKTAEDLAADGLILLAADMEFATPTDALMGHKPQYDLEVQQALTFIKPSFNEEMRGGHTNM
jgi:glycine betaine/choline ABC-type transport system substrate-binding protein